MKKSLFISVIAVFLLFAYKINYGSNAGVTGGTFLKLIPNSRIIGLGEAFTAVADDPSAIVFNPAGLGDINNLEILFSHFEWIIDLDYEFFSVTKPVFKGLYDFKGVMGFGITYLHLPFFGDYDDWGVQVGNINFNDIAFMLGYGQQIFDFNVGTTFKLIREQVDDITDYGMGIDIGVLYNLKLPFKKAWIFDFRGKVLRMGMSLINLTLNDINGASLPTEFRFGLSSEVFNDFTVAVDLDKPFDNRIRLNTGIEYNIRNYFNIRAGYRFFGYKVDSFSVGLGFRYPLGSKLIKVDAGYAPAGTLNNTSILTFGLKFPGVSSSKDWKMANILYYKGIYYYTNGDLDKAIQLWKEVLKYNPDHQKAKKKIKDAEYLKGLQKIENKVKKEYRMKQEK